jgi:hypothetical protein
MPAAIHRAAVDLDMPQTLVPLRTNVRNDIGGSAARQSESLARAVN